MSSQVELRKNISMQSYIEKQFIIYLGPHHSFWEDTLKEAFSLDY